MPRMLKDEAIRAALLRTDTIKSDGPVKLHNISREQSQAAAIAARRAELARAEAKKENSK